MGKGDTHVKKHDKRKMNYYSDELVIPNDSQGEFIGEIIGTLGDSRFTVKKLDDTIEIQATALGSFRKGPRKQFINPKDYVVVQPGVSKNQFYINHLYSPLDINKLFERGFIGKPKKSTIVESVDEEEEEQAKEADLTMEDIWDAI